jgi:hypothetical protein
MPAPTLMYVNEMKEKQYVSVDAQNIVTIGSSRKLNDCTVVLPDLPCVDDRHLIVYENEDEGGFWVKNVGKQNVFLDIVSRNVSEYLNAGEAKRLGIRTSITFGDATDRKNSVTIYWSDPEGEEQEDANYRELRQRTETDSVFEGELDRMRADFFNQLQNVEPSIQKVAQFIAVFIKKKFPVLSTVLIYRRVGAMWSNLISIRRRRKGDYQPSHTLFRAVLAKRTPILVRVRNQEIEIDEEKEQPSLSIVDNNARRVILIPVIQKNESVGMLYLESEDETLDKRAYSLLCRLCSSGISATLAGYVSEDKNKESRLSITKGSIPKKWGWRIWSYRDKYRPISVYSNMHGIGEGHLVFGYCGQDLDHLVRVRSFIAGMLSSKMGAFDIKAVEDFAKESNPYAEFRMVDLQLEYSIDGDMDDDFEFEEDEDVPRLREVKLKTKSWLRQHGEQLPNDEDEYGYDFHVVGDLNVYLGRGDSATGLNRQMLTGRVKRTGIHVGDFVMFSPIKVPRKAFQPPFDLELMKKYAKDFLLLVRDK